MLILKKLIHLVNLANHNISLEINSKSTNYLIVSLFQFKNSFILYKNLFENFNWIKLNKNYINKYAIKLKALTKYLFLFTSYIIYSKLNNVINIFFFKFHLLSKKQKKFTILRAPCNHKNSKEQFGLTTFKANIKGNLTYQKNNFYNTFFLSLLNKERLTGLTELYKKYEKKYET